MSKSKRSRTKKPRPARGHGGKTGEALRKEALAHANRNIAAIEARASKPHPRMKAQKLSGLDAAAKVLVESKQPLNATTIAERAIAAGWKTNGKTPHATLHAAMIREIAAKGRESRFKKTERGMFTATTIARSA